MKLSAFHLNLALLSTMNSINAAAIPDNVADYISYFLESDYDNASYELVFIQYSLFNRFSHLTDNAEYISAVSAQLLSQVRTLTSQYPELTAVYDIDSFYGSTAQDAATSTVASSTTRRSSATSATTDTAETTETASSGIALATGTTTSDEEEDETTGTSTVTGGRVTSTGSATTTATSASSSAVSSVSSVGSSSSTSNGANQAQVHVLAAGCIAVFASFLF